MRIKLDFKNEKRKKIAYLLFPIIATLICMTFGIVVFFMFNAMLGQYGIGIYFVIMGVITYAMFIHARDIVIKRLQVLDESEEQFRTAITSTSDGIRFWELTRDDELSMPQWSKILGHNKKDYPEDYSVWLKSVHPDDKERIINIHKDLFNKKVSCYQIEYRVMTKEGNYNWILSRGSAVYDKKGNVLRVIGSHTNIDERKKIEEALRLSEERYRNAINGSNDGIWEWNIKTNEVYFSPRWKDMLGYSEDEIPTYFELWSKLVHPDDIERVKESHQAHIRKETDFYQEEYRILTKSGKYKWILSRAQATWDADGNPIRFSGSHTDIEERKKMEEELFKSYEENKRLLNQEMEYINLKTEFFANISHELRTPLNVMSSTLQLIELHNKDKNSNEITCKKKYVNIMQQNCLRLLKLINNLIDITKIDAGYVQLNLHNYNIVQITEQITLSVAEYANNKSLKLQFDTDIEEKVIACDADMIERIILNLLSNSIKFTTPGGNIWVNLHDKGDKIIISVKDTGIGIPEDKQQTIFERFRQIDDYMTRDYEGSGIGLSLVKALVEMHDGKILLTSKYGKGSEFIIELPTKILPEEVPQTRNSSKRSYSTRATVEFSDIYSYNIE